jgi:DNA-binding transcriptional LysR family regulator
MYGMHLSAIDANLLVVLHALLEERSVTRAALRVGLSPSATSHALARLRDLLGDELLVRAGRRLVATPRGEALVEPLGRVVTAMEGVLRVPDTFDPKTLRRAFRVATTDHVQFVMLRKLDATLRSEAPHVDLHFLPLPQQSAPELREGRLDFAIGVWDDPTPDIGREPLFEDQLISVVRRRHPALKGAMTLRRFAALDHVLVAPNGTATGLLDRQLAAHGMSRRISRLVPTFLDAPFLVAQSNHVVTLPAGLVRPLLSLLRLSVMRAPLPLPRFTISMIWHLRFDADPAHRWFRSVLSRAAQGLDMAARRQEPTRSLRATSGPR